MVAVILECTGQNDQMVDQWVWDGHCAPAAVKLSSNFEAAYFHTDPVNMSTGTVGESYLLQLHCFFPLIILRF